MLVSRTAVNAYLDRELRSYTWMKRLRRETILAELARFDVPPKFKTEPWLHQLVCFYIGMCEPYFLFLLDMGLGKSKIITDLITQSIREREVKRALIGVPRTINMTSWRDDLLVHSDLEPWPVTAENREEKRDMLLNPQGEVTVIDYQGLQWAVCDKVEVKKKKKVAHELRVNPKLLRRVQELYGFVGLDESHYLQNPDNLWFQIITGVTERARRVYATTGTLFNKDPKAAWAQFYLVDRGATFGDDLSLFLGAFYTQEEDGWVGVKHIYNKRRSGDLHRMLQNASIRYDEDEVPETEVPTRHHVRVDLDFDPEQREHYLHALQGLINAQGGDPSEIDAPWIRMRQILSGYLEWNDANGKHLVKFKRNPKLEELERLIGEMGDSKLVVVHYYQQTGKLITDRLKELKIKHTWLYGGTRDKEAVKRQFMTDPECRVFVMNSESGGTGNDGLQKVARYMYMFEGPTSPTPRNQVIKRLHRPGQRDRVFIYDPVIKRSLDSGILADLAEGRDMYEAVVNGRRIRRDILRG